MAIKDNRPPRWRWLHPYLPGVTQPLQDMHSSTRTSLHVTSRCHSAPPTCAASVSSLPSTARDIQG
eukprot:363862-Chlamydomonas_euryale.AAC.16